MANVYILLTKTGTFFSQAIGLYTKEPYNHVSISIDKELTELYSFGRKKTCNPLRAGFVKENIQDGVYAKFPDTTCEVYALQVSKRQKEKIERTIRHFKQNKNDYRYNLLGIAAVPFGKSLERKYAYFCSQFVATVLKMAGIELWDKPLGLITPGEYRSTRLLQKVYEGPLSTYIATLTEEKPVSIQQKMIQV
ncbi:hypothetical protein SAMN05421676_11152 [Salinibacillus kushneri]|uniref:Permuted papain-like amidase enzyme, YaeF/YiiX, C92 family n=1 Tax=Salinibacillus kushneri TaxID=237682 RepID=A0A1I0I8R7_9BACI|nr:hypothetical protein [Salinibacillus kushneri]SET93086.1 hypothetical protein SAMN05421676_11152 [Salinibacillus kushneri]